MEVKAVKCINAYLEKNKNYEDSYLKAALKSPAVNKPERPGAVLPMSIMK